MADMTRSEKLVSIASKLYEARKTVRWLWGDEYKARIAEHVEKLKRAAQHHNKDVIAMALVFAKEFAKPENDARGGDMATLIIFAAAVEATEPTP